MARWAQPPIRPGAGRQRRVAVELEPAPPALPRRQPDCRLRDLAVALEVTERTAFGLVAALVEAGYVLKERDGRRRRYHVRSHLPLPDSTDRSRTLGELLDLLGDVPGGRSTAN